MTPSDSCSLFSTSFLTLGVVPYQIQSIHFQPCAILRPSHTNHGTMRSVSFLQLAVTVSCLATTVLSMPAFEPTRTKGQKHRAWRLPKTDKSKYNGEDAPPTFTPIPLGQLDVDFANVSAIAPVFESTDGNVDVQTRNLLTERTVFGVDNRVLLKNAAYPYSAMGRLLWSDGTYCTASLVGDNYVMTASHCVPWDDSSISIIFQPGFNDTEVNGHAQVTDIVYLRKNDASNFNGTACGVYFDVALMKLDSGLSAKVGGTLGVQQWTTVTSSKELYDIGYPFDLAGGARPYIQTGVQGTINSAFQCASDGPLTTQVDSSSGQSGGPLWLPSASSIVGVLSASGDSDTVFSSGAPLVKLVAWAATNWAS